MRSQIVKKVYWQEWEGENVMLPQHTHTHTHTLHYCELISNWVAEKLPIVTWPGRHDTRAVCVCVCVCVWGPVLPSEWMIVLHSQLTAANDTAKHTHTHTSCSFIRFSFTELLQGPRTLWSPTPSPPHNNIHPLVPTHTPLLIRSALTLLTHTQQHTHTHTHTHISWLLCCSLCMFTGSVLYVSVCIRVCVCVLTELMFSWLRRTRSISGVSMTAVPQPTSSLYRTWTEQRSTLRIQLSFKSLLTVLPLWCHKIIFHYAKSPQNGLYRHPFL